MHYQSREELNADLAEIVARELAEGVAARGRATLAVPGGTTPGPFLQALSAWDIPWDKITVMLTDERFVPESSDRSNTRLIRGTLLQNRAAAARFVPFYAKGDAPEDVIDDLIADVSAALPLDVCVLGMGEDMHTASIFPGADRLDEALSDDAPVLLPMRAPGAPEPRMTLSAPVLRAARALHLLIMGEGKSHALEAALKEGPASEAPVRAVLSAPEPITVHYAD
ncbi:6-phosphogluconolactonase [Oceanibium sediminis]|uniref:6-phosphogluconolactonase n=1 Tax=Oceanibium sediminis TaxID=2026339 RepID=UPI000DD329EE|nr:6-phosphogluconolactonase [Oceanibium sediminis]